MKKETAKIPEQVLKKYDAKALTVDKGQTVFREGEVAHNFFIVRRGRIKMVNLSKEGKEFVQGYFTEGQSFGEPPFFSEEPYPADAVAVSPSEVWKIGRVNFLRLLKENFDIHLAITRALGLRLIYKSIMLSEIAIEEAEHRIKTLLAFLKEGTRDGEGGRTIPFSRQQLADMAGLRVETVIRIVKKLESRKQLKLTRDGKILQE